MADPQPLYFHARITVPQNTLQDQNSIPTADQLQTDLQAGLDADTSLPPGTSVEVK